MAESIGTPTERQLGDDQRRELEEHVRTVLHGGYADRDELAEAAEDYLVDGDDRPVSPEQARRLVERLWRERVAEQAGWEGETDPERLARAFASLRAAGITAAENFTCCSSCGYAEIGAAGAPDPRGFTFFHTQSTDAAVAGRGLILQYGGFDDSVRTTTAIGREVVAALQEVGLSTDWNGSPDRAIKVTPLVWRRRLVG